MNFSILALEGCRAGTVFGIRDVLDVGSTVAQIVDADNASAITSNIVTMTGGAFRTSNGAVLPDTELATRGNLGEVLIVPGCFNNPETIECNLSQFSAAARIVRDHHANGNIVFASCSAVFVFGLAGLLDGRRATATWWAQPLLRSLFPKALVEDETMLTEQDGIFCAAGPFSYGSALIPLIARALGSDIAGLTAKFAMIDEWPGPQGPFRSSLVQRRFYPLPYRIEQIVRQKLPISPSVNDIAMELSMTPRTLQRRLRASGQATAKEIVDRTRANVAHELIIASEMPLRIIAEATGFSDDSSFRRVFKKVYGMPPSQFR